MKVVITTSVMITTWVLSVGQPISIMVCRPWAIRLGRGGTEGESGHNKEVEGGGGGGVMDINPMIFISSRIHSNELSSWASANGTLTSTLSAEKVPKTEAKYKNLSTSHLDLWKETQSSIQVGPVVVR